MEAMAVAGFDPNDPDSFLNDGLFAVKQQPMTSLPLPQSTIPQSVPQSVQQPVSQQMSQQVEPSFGDPTRDFFSNTAFDAADPFNLQDLSIPTQNVTANQKKATKASAFTAAQSLPQPSFPSMIPLNPSVRKPSPTPEPMIEIDTTIPASNYENMSDLPPPGATFNNMPNGGVPQITIEPLLSPKTTKFVSAQQEDLKRAFMFAEDSWAYDFLFEESDEAVAALVMNPAGFRQGCYAEVDVQAMEAGARVFGAPLMDFKHTFNWLIVPGFNRDHRVAGVLASETIEDTDNICVSMPKHTIGRFIRDEETSEMLIFTYIKQTGQAKLVWLKNTETFRQERKYFRLKYEAGKPASTHPEEILYSVQCIERVPKCFRCLRQAAQCKCAMGQVLRRPRTPLDFDAFEYNMEVHDGIWQGASQFYMRIDRPGLKDMEKKLTTTLTAKGFGDHPKMNDLRCVVQRMWLCTMPFAMSVSVTPAIGWREPPQMTEAEQKALRKKLRNREAAARCNARRRENMIKLKAGLKEVREQLPKVQEREKELKDENRRLREQCVARGILLPVGQL